jgi:tRNA dimethylallyltransferase
MAGAGSASKPPGRTTPQPLVVVAGPTASGKSALALAIGREFAGTVVNADSLQVYRELRLLTARPDEAAEAALPHRLYGGLPAAERCSAGRWAALAEAEIAAAHRAGRLPILVGGTGLYLRALLQGLAPIAAVPAAIEAAAAADLARLGPAAFHRALAARDPVTAARLRPSDRQRLIRAWSVLEATGRSLAQWQEAPVPRPGSFAPLVFCLMPDRARLYAACDRRFVAIMAAGGLAEAAGVGALGLDPALPAMKALGLRELLSHLAGEMPLAAAVAAAQQATRNYAKRQLTWFRHQLPEAECLVLNASSGKFLESLGTIIFPKIRRFLLTGPA